MKKKLIIASIIAAITATAYAGAKCIQCKGTGWNGSYRCASCGGDGEVGN